MPYIPQKERGKLDPKIESLARMIVLLGGSWKGKSNYAITKLLLRVVERTHGTISYDILSDVIATLECAKLEMYARKVRPYENGAIQRNGDLKEF